MAGYYDRLEDQLARATTRGVPRRRRLVGGLQLPRPRLQWLAAAATVAVCVAVSLALIFGTRSAHEHHRTGGPDHGHVRPPVIRNYAPDRVPALGGQPVCNATLTAPRGARSATGMMVVHSGPNASYVYSLSARGLKPAPAGESYELWTIPEATLTSGGYQVERGVAPRLFGVITPPIAADGLLAAKGTIPSSFSGSYRLLITAQRPAAKSPGRVVLKGDVPL